MIITNTRESQKSKYNYIAKKKGTYDRSKLYRVFHKNSRKIEEAQKVADEIKTLGCDWITIQADVSRENDCVRLIEYTIRRYGS